MSTERDTPTAACAHLTVTYRNADHRLSEADVAAMAVRYDPESIHVPPRVGQIVTRGWWACRNCDTTFVPRAALSTSEDERARLREAIRWALGEIMDDGSDLRGRRHASAEESRRESERETAAAER